MPFERRETLLGIVPLGRWKKVETGTVDERYDGVEGPFSLKSNRTLFVDVTSSVPLDEQTLTVKSRTRIADPWTSFRDLDTVQQLTAGDRKRVRVFGPNPGHCIVFRSKPLQTRASKR